MLPRFKNALQVHEPAVALREVPVHFRRTPAFVENADAIGRALAVPDQPSKSTGVELIARIISPGCCSHLFDDPVALQRKKQEPDDLVDVHAAKSSIRSPTLKEPALHVLTVGAAG